MGIEIEAFESAMSVALFSKNFEPVGTRYLTLRDHELFLPTVAVLRSASDNEPIELNIYWQTVVSVPPHFYMVRNTTTDDNSCGLSLYYYVVFD